MSNITPFTVSYKIINSNNIINGIYKFKNFSMKDKEYKFEFINLNNGLTKICICYNPLYQTKLLISLSGYNELYYKEKLIDAKDYINKINITLGYYDIIPLDININHDNKFMVNFLECIEINMYDNIRSHIIKKINIYKDLTYLANLKDQCIKRYLTQEINNLQKHNTFLKQQNLTFKNKLNKVKNVLR